MRDLGAALAKALRREPSRMMRSALRRWEGWLSLRMRRASLRANLRDPAPGRALRAWAANAAERRRTTGRTRDERNPVKQGSEGEGAAEEGGAREEQHDEKKHLLWCNVEHWPSLMKDT